MSETTVVHVNDPAGYDIYIGRAVPSRGLPASPWGNPFRMGRHDTRAQVIARYERWIRSRPELLARLPDLKGKRLGCWCKKRGVDVPCHGDVLVKLIEEFYL